MMSDEEDERRERNARIWYGVLQFHRLRGYLWGDLSRQPSLVDGRRPRTRRRGGPIHAGLLDNEPVEPTFPIFDFVWRDEFVLGHHYGDPAMRLIWIGDRIATIPRGR